MAKEKADQKVWVKNIGRNRVNVPNFKGFRPGESREFNLSIAKHLSRCPFLEIVDKPKTEGKKSFKAVELKSGEKL